MKVYVTKYALTAGIQEKEGEIVGDRMIKIGGDYFHKHDWHDSREAAVARANEMRKAKIASVKRQLAKLEAMTF